ncbi:hypothetical protein Taro_034811 [Colocasia esculenta]|uniref:Uncharacterized protein n=1 Tax=Colocasia esculenta TaxID=4460 RepID=A0A843WGL5_COLES|nr:hypothetical protein [Colocasia esculenta]
MHRSVRYASQAATLSGVGGARVRHVPRNGGGHCRQGFSSRVPARTPQLPRPGHQKPEEDTSLQKKF